MNDTSEWSDRSWKRLGLTLFIMQTIVLWEAFKHVIFAVYLWGQGREIGIHPWSALLGAFLGFALYRAARLLPRPQALDAERHPLQDASESS